MRLPSFINHIDQRDNCTWWLVKLQSFTMLRPYSPPTGVIRMIMNMMIIIIMIDVDDGDDDADDYPATTTAVDDDDSADNNLRYAKRWRHTLHSG